MDIEKLVRPNIKKLKPYTSARDSYLSGTLMDANENSLGSVINNDLELNRYPDPAQGELREKLGKVLGIEKDKLFLGVGSDEIIDLLIRIFCEPVKSSVIIPEPTYGMYKVSCDINDVPVIETELDNDFQPVNETIFSLSKASTKMLFLCSPNNPTGNVLDKDKVEKLVKSFEGVVVVDEAYIDFEYQHTLAPLIEQYDNLVVLRTFSKAWGLAGIRCGYCIASKKIIEYLFKVKAPYNMNKLTADTVLHALDKVEKRNEYIALLSSERNRVIAELRKIDKIDKVFPSNANFVLFKVDNARMVFGKLADKGIIIRDRSNQVNLQNCLRVSIGSKQENDNFLNTLRSIL